MNKSITDVEVVDEIPLEQTIENTLVKHNVTDAVINSLKEKYGSLRLKSLDDKESYLEVKEAKKNVRKIGILTEKLCEAGRADAVKVQKLWLGKQKEILTKIAEVEDPLQAEIDRYDAEVKRKEDEIERLKQEESIKRQQTLTKMGATYSDGYFTLANASYDANVIKDADAEMWNDVIFPKYDREYQRIEAVRIEQERLKAEQEEKLRKEREDFEAQQKAFKEQQELFAKQQLEAQKERLEQERKEQERKAQEVRLKNEADNQRWRNRLSLLDEIGWNGQFAFPKLGDNEAKVFTYDELVELSDETFNVRMKEYNDSTAKIKKEIAEKAEEKRLADIQIAQEEAARKERERIEEENRQAEIKKQQEIQRQQEEMAKSNDKTKWEHLLKQFNAIALPEMKSGIYKGKLAILREKLDDLNSL